MAYENPVLRKSWDAAADLSTKQFRAVRLNGSGKLAVCVAGEPAVGLLQTKPTADQAGDVEISGISRAILGGTVVEMDELASDANGALVKRTPGAALVAIAYEGGAAAAVIAVKVAEGGEQGGPLLTLSAGAEGGPGANIIAVTAALKNPNGTAVAVATKVHVKTFDTDATLTDGGAGTMEFGTTTTEGMFTTDATDARDMEHDLEQRKRRERRRHVHPRGRRPDLHHAHLRLICSVPLPPPD